MSRMVRGCSTFQVRVPHLTDDQLTECALRRPSPASEAHLAHCDRCRDELIALLALRDQGGRRQWTE